MSSSRIRAVAAVGLAAVALTALSSVTAPASAMGKPVLKAVYKASGSTFIKSTGSQIALPATKLSVSLDAKGNFTGTLPLKPTTTSFKVAGLVPVTATVTFTATAKTTGRLAANPNTHVTASAKYRITLSNVTTLLGLPLLVGDSCSTVDPVAITVATPKGKTFDVTKGGVVAGTYTIGQFANCGFTTSLVNQLVPGTGNTVKFTLSGGKVTT